MNCSVHSLKKSAVPDEILEIAVYHPNRTVSLPLFNRCLNCSQFDSIHFAKIESLQDQFAVFAK